MLSALLFVSVFSVSAADVPDHSDLMNITTSWINDETLRIDVMDVETGDISSVVIKLSDYIGEGSEAPYIDIQAVDSEGNQLGTIRIDNPFHITEDESMMPLNGGVQSRVVVEPTHSPEPTPTQTEPIQPEVPTAPEPDTEAPSANNGNSAGLIIFIIILVLAAAGGAVYYFLFIRRKTYYDESGYDDDNEDYDDYKYQDGDDENSKEDEMHDYEMNERGDDE